ncbi:MAG TPA: 2-hydroxychromene-2-carboxylate isomerase [Polyangiaceae bacterium LLY-WYZ-15_(1-7)]|nr:disulfide bond formation protein DsbA [Sandaracinus sp.]HJL00339.1 2-hydroxychromene-2-carboxylate isomerase [Polyangiaceae bacterium LLY-WYZ-15_(1-7)]HJL07827.1 2-hydroxychromene-2-carboxylate isomerase [Polyangiaceae bacterium LLY-WYZ-15_(1-7)]HJL24924.1 2-hydroxychromene-2-carboxylate isomerase [Polyangiaceae bacterium LLY-WYZ-15_(1-7)]HJL29249.1 2-hydroxychromene-2-carboxylate isomerase [Polyangiaceae bacterium LLY-WYZ-15_(1-7)]
MRFVELWYDLSCPYAYLASTQVEALAAETGAELRYRPFLLGGVFRALRTADDPNRTMAPAKMRHNLLDMRRWAAWFGVPLEMPPGHPQRTVLALRALLAAGEAARPAATHALFRAYWAEGRDLTRPDEVAAALDAAGCDGSACVAAAPAQKAALFEATDAALAKGVFGAPAFVVPDGEGGEALYWGQDRLAFVRAALER